MKNNIKFNIFISVIIICIVISLLVLNIFSNKVIPIFMSYASSELKVISATLINKVVSSNISNLEDVDELVIITKSSDDEIQMIDFNPTILNKILNSTTEYLLSNLKSVENGAENLFSSNIDVSKYSSGIIYQIPIGVVFDNVFLSNLGPKIPVKFNVVGDVSANIKTSIKEYGINNALIEVYIDVSVTEKIIVPFMSDVINVSVSVPVSLKLIQGNIPIYYGSGFTKNSNILSTPTE